MFDFGTFDHIGFDQSAEEAVAVIAEEPGGDGFNRRRRSRAYRSLRQKWLAENILEPTRVLEYRKPKVDLPRHDENDDEEALIMLLSA